MQRYELYKYQHDAEMEPQADGAYVLHSEAQARIEALESALRAMIEHVKILSPLDAEEGCPVCANAVAALEKQP